MRALYFIVFFILINNFHHCFCLNDSHRLLQDAGTIAHNNSDEVSETQHATCRISTEELVASAQASVTRVLTGVCNADVVNENFQNLERVIRQELDDIKQILNNLAAGNTQNIFNAIIDPRQQEIDRFNNTVTTTNTPTGVERRFVYFMRVEDFVKKMAFWESGQFERSSTIYLPLRPYAIYVKVIPKDIRHNKLYVSVGVGLTRGIYDEALEWPFSLKHRVEILDHSAQQFRTDITPGIIDPLNSGSTEIWGKPDSSFGNGDNPDKIILSVPANIILTNIQPQLSVRSSNTTKYLWKNDLIIKLVVYF